MCVFFYWCESHSLYISVGCMPPFPALQSNVFLYIRNRELLLPWESVVGIELTGLMQASVVRSSRGCGLMGIPSSTWAPEERSLCSAAGPAGHLWERGWCGGVAGSRGQGAARRNESRAVVSTLLCVVFSLTQKIRWCHSPHPAPCLYHLQKLEMCKEDQYWCV